MTNMKQTKEQLIIEITKLRQSHAEWVEGDERRRREFAKAFGWTKNTSSSYGYSEKEPEFTTPSWPQVFVKLGKLLSSEKFEEISGQIKFQDGILTEIEQRIKQLENHD